MLTYIVLVHTNCPVYGVSTESEAVTIMPLTMTECGREVVIQRIAGKDNVRRHLNEMGFVEGEKVVVISDNGGNMILSIKGARIALDKSMTNRIQVVH